MAVSAQRLRRTVDEYLELERDSEIKHEYYGGRLYAMAGASPEHVYIADNVYSELRAKLYPSRCRAATNGLRIYVEKAGLHIYADVFVVCGEAR